MAKRFGDDVYAMEELVAELGAAFQCAELGISSEPRADHAQYLAHWLEPLEFWLTQNQALSLCLVAFSNRITGSTYPENALAVMKADKKAIFTAAERLSPYLPLSNN